MKKFTEQNTDEVRKVIQRKLDEAAKELGIDKIKMGGIGWSEGSVKSSLECTIIEAMKNDPIVLDFLAMYGLPADLIGRSFKSGSKDFIVDHIDFKKIKYPIICKGVKGGQYKLTIEQVKAAF